MAELGAFLDIVMNYLTLQLSRCAISSVFLLFAILVLRKLFKKTTFLKGMLWSTLGIILFVGKLKIYYENPIVVRFTWWWTNMIMGNYWFSRIYLIGIITVGSVILFQRHKLNRYVNKMERKNIQGVSIHICEALVTPFTIGVIKPKVVLSKQMIEKYTNEDLAIIIKHEKIHHQLGHLLFFALWDILRILLWINPLLTLCFPYFKQDMEEICDYITIRNNGNQNKVYGEILIKSILLLKTSQNQYKYSATLTSEKEYQAVKQRLLKIVNYQPQKQSTIKWIALLTLSMFASLLLIVNVNSYHNYQISDGVEIYDMTGTKRLIKSDQLYNIVYFDNEKLYIRSKEWNELIQKSGLEESYFLFFFGNFEKMPGYGGGGNCVEVSQTMLSEEVQAIKYNTHPSLMVWIFKMI